jgi:hypothetical protein
VDTFDVCVLQTLNMWKYIALWTNHATYHLFKIKCTYSASHADYLCVFNLILNYTLFFLNRYWGLNSGLCCLLGRCTPVWARPPALTCRILKDRDYVLFIFVVSPFLGTLTWPQLAPNGGFLHFYSLILVSEQRHGYLGKTKMVR